jgi:hypothetical protein
LAGCGRLAPPTILQARTKHVIARVIGKALRGIRAGDKHLACHDPALSTVPVRIRLTSSAFEDGRAIPIRYAGEGAGENISPPLSWSGVPEDAAELVLIMQDPDAPLPRPVVHLIATGIPPSSGGLAEGALGASGSDEPRSDDALMQVPEPCVATVSTAMFSSLSPCGGHWPSRKSRP